jgi:hypothetical protein
MDHTVAGATVGAQCRDFGARGRPRPKGRTAVLTGVVTARFSGT